MPLERLGAQAMEGFRRDRLAIRPGTSNLRKLLSRVAPGVVLRMTNGSVDAMLAQTRA